MGHKIKEKRVCSPKSVSQAHSTHTLRHVIAIASILLLVLTALYVSLKRPHSSQVEPTTSAPASAAASAVLSLGELLKMSPEQLGNVDVAVRNLLCATGLPGAEKLDISECLAKLDEWTKLVKSETDRHLYRAHDPQWADHYKHSENWLRAEMLAQVLQEDCGVRYNMERVRNIDFTNSKDLFIHGMIGDINGGTCASMPVLYVAVGRRLGYPLKLVLTKAHIFVRWDDGKERFNIETTSTGGTDSYPDEHYTTWPEKISTAEVQANRYLISLSPAEELACFLASRGHCLLDIGRTQEASDAYAAAHRLAPKDPAYLAWTRQAQVLLGKKLDGLSFREGQVRYPDILDEVNRINAMNRANRERFGQSPAPGVAQPPFPGVPRPAPQPFRPAPEQQRR